MINIALTTIDSRIMKTFFASFYANEENKTEKIRNTTLHVFIDNRRYNYDELHAAIEAYHKEYCPDVEVCYYTNMHEYLINHFSFKDEDTLNYIKYQTHHIKMSIPLILHEKNIDKFFFTDDDVIFLKSPEKYFSKEYDEYVSVMLKDCFTRYYKDVENSINEFNAFRQNVENPKEITIEEFNKIGIKSVGQFLFNYLDSYEMFLRKFYTNSYITTRFLTKVYDVSQHKVIARGRINLSFLDEQKALSFYLNEYPMGKFERKDIVIYYDKPVNFVKREKHLKRHEKNMLVHYGTSQKDFYIEHFFKQYS